MIYIWSENFAVLPMRYSTQIKPISYLKANAAQILEESSSSSSDHS